eukprot:1180059-Prorocentrum_minimum.AAC.1
MSWRYPVLEAHSPIISDGGGYSDPAWFHWYCLLRARLARGGYGRPDARRPEGHQSLSPEGDPPLSIYLLYILYLLYEVDIRVGDDTILRKSASPSVTHLDSPGAGRVSRDEFLYSTQVFTRMTNFSRGHHQTGVGNALKKHYSKRFPSHSLMCRTRIESHAYIHHLAHSSAPIRSKPRSRLSASHVAVCRQGIYVEYSADYSKCRALNGILVSTVDDTSIPC